MTAYRQGRCPGRTRTRHEREAKYVRIPLERELMRFGWDYYHVHDSRRDRRGFPDLIAYKDFEDICCDLVIECKYGAAQPTDEQVKWLDHWVRRFRHDAYSWACVIREADLEWLVYYLQSPQTFKPPGIWEG